MLTVILTSYNRPRLVRKTLSGLMCQTDPRWQCLILDDGSNQETLDVIQQFTGDIRFRAVTICPTPEERAATARYATNINLVLPQIKVGIVGYLCDNVEYHPQLVSRVLAFFDRTPDAFAGYVIQVRDIWRRENDGEGPDGEYRMGGARENGMQEILPLLQAPQIPAGMIDKELDHSQVFHRAPIDMLWDDSLEVKHRGDGAFYERMAEKYGPLHAIAPGEVLTLEHTLPILTVIE